MHMNGLSRMVRLRGGLEIITDGNPMTGTIVFW